MSDKVPDYAHADPCRQELRSVYVFDLFVSRPSAPDLSSKLDQLSFKADAPPAHLTEVNVGVFFEQALPPSHLSSTYQHSRTPHPRPTNHLTTHVRPHFTQTHARTHTRTRPLVPAPHTCDLTLNLSLSLSLTLTLTRSAQWMTSCTSSHRSSTPSTAGETNVTTRSSSTTRTSSRHSHSLTNFLLSTFVIAYGPNFLEARQTTVTPHRPFLRLRVRVGCG